MDDNFRVLRGKSVSINGCGVGSVSIANPSSNLRPQSASFSKSSKGSKTFLSKQRKTICSSKNDFNKLNSSPGHLMSDTVTNFHNRRDASYSENTNAEEEKSSKGDTSVSEHQPALMSNTDRSGNNLGQLGVVHQEESTSVASQQIYNAEESQTKAQPSIAADKRKKKVTKKRPLTSGRHKRHLKDSNLEMTSVSSKPNFIDSSTGITQSLLSHDTKILFDDTWANPEGNIFAAHRFERNNAVGRFFTTKTSTNRRQVVRNAAELHLQMGKFTLQHPTSPNQPEHANPLSLQISSIGKVSQSTFKFPPKNPTKKDTSKTFSKVQINNFLNTETRNPNVNPSLNSVSKTVSLNPSSLPQHYNSSGGTDGSTSTQPNSSTFVSSQDSLKSHFNKEEKIPRKSATEVEGITYIDVSSDRSKRALSKENVIPEHYSRPLSAMGRKSKLRSKLDFEQSRPKSAFQRKHSTMNQVGFSQSSTSDRNVENEELPKTRCDYTLQRYDSYLQKNKPKSIQEQYFEKIKKKRILQKLSEAYRKGVDSPAKKQKREEQQMLHMQNLKINIDPPRKKNSSIRIRPRSSSGMYQSSDNNHVSQNTINVQIGSEFQSKSLSRSSTPNFGSSTSNDLAEGTSYHHTLDRSERIPTPSQTVMPPSSAGSSLSTLVRQQSDPFPLTIKSLDSPGASEKRVATEDKVSVQIPNVEGNNPSIPPSKPGYSPKNSKSPHKGNLRMFMSKSPKSESHQRDILQNTYMLDNPPSIDSPMHAKKQNADSNDQFETFLDPEMIEKINILLQKLKDPNTFIESTNSLLHLMNTSKMGTKILQENVDLVEFIITQFTTIKEDEHGDNNQVIAIINLLSCLCKDSSENRRIFKQHNGVSKVIILLDKLTSICANRDYFVQFMKNIFQSDFTLQMDFRLNGGIEKTLGLIDESEPQRNSEAKIGILIHTLSSAILHNSDNISCFVENNGIDILLSFFESGESIIHEYIGICLGSLAKDNSSLKETLAKMNALKSYVNVLERHPTEGIIRSIGQICSGSTQNQTQFLNLNGLQILLQIVSNWKFQDLSLVRRSLITLSIISKSNPSIQQYFNKRKLCPILTKFYIENDDCRDEGAMLVTVLVENHPKNQVSFSPLITPMIHSIETISHIDSVTSQRITTLSLCLRSLCFNNARNIEKLRNNSHVRALTRLFGLLDTKSEVYFHLDLLTRMISNV